MNALLVLMEVLIIAALIFVGVVFLVVDPLTAGWLQCIGVAFLVAGGAKAVRFLATVRA